MPEGEDGLIVRAVDAVITTGFRTNWKLNLRRRPDALRSLT